MQRSSGLLLHPTALTNPLRIGSLGKEAHLFVDFLARAGQSVWQILPLGPTGYGHSPYNALSAFAGNPALIDLQQLVDCGDLEASRLAEAISQSAEIDFDRAHEVKTNLALEAGRCFLNRPDGVRKKAFDAYCLTESDWLEDFSLFMALRNVFSGQAWTEWPLDLRSRQRQSLAIWQEKLSVECNLYKYQQFIFAEQWRTLKCYANHNGVQIFGDIPIFVAHDSADVWANQHLFQLDELGHATAVAGVPPDYFSATGQRWGNPLYRWDQLAGEDFNWWLRRLDHQLQCCDILRIDHFRGFLACWSIPAEEKTAVKGHWEEVPGRELFARLRAEKTVLPIVAEDLGVITPEVEELRNDLGFPGMKILQFAFDSGPDNPYLPENYTNNCVVYTGTHDNDTTLGWWQGLTSKSKNQVRKYLGKSRPDIPWTMINLAMASVADLCIIPCQDILSLGKSARFNTPGRATGNWDWHLTADSLTDELADRLRETTERYRRTVPR
jgi:4-alpha-glucanotransferase